MPEARRAALHRLARWGGGAVLAGSIAFIGERLWRLDPGQLVASASWPLAGALGAATLAFAAADAALARGWAILADPDKALTPRAAGGIYGRGVLLKYLPGSVFQYVSRQLGGANAGLGHARLARASLHEIGLHVAASTSVAALCLVAGQGPLTALAGAAGLSALLILSRRSLWRALACQLVAFGAFALAAMLVGAALLPEGIRAGHFAALFLLAWLAGFVIPVAPGGLGVREAALLALGGATVPAPALLTAVLALRVASVLGDLLYGLIALARGRRA